MKPKNGLPHPYQKTSVFDDPPRKNVLLLSCMDQRLLDETVHFMNFLNLQNRYDQITLAGAAMGVHRLPKVVSHSDAKWWKVFTDHLSTATNKLHRPIKDVFLVDHLDCGAYMELHPDDKIKEAYKTATLDEMWKMHEFELRGLAQRVQVYCDDQLRKADNEFEATKKACGKVKKCWSRIEKDEEEKAKGWKNIRVSCFIMDINGNVTQLDVPKGEQATLKRQS